VSAARGALAWLMVAGLHTAFGAGLVDPTRPPPGYGATPLSGDARSADTAAAPEPIRLQMIARDATSHMAVVNGHRVRAGDSIPLDGSSVKVVKIDDDSVVLDQSGHRRILELKPRLALVPACASLASHRPTCRGDLPGASR